MQYEILQEATESLRVIHSRAARSDDDKTLCQAGVLAGVLLALDMLVQNEDLGEFKQESARFVVAAQKVFGVDEWIKQVMAVMVARRDSGPLLNEFIPPPPTRLENTQMYRSILGYSRSAH